jgi:hypothetical protein
MDKKRANTLINSVPKPTAPNTIPCDDQSLLDLRFTRDVINLMSKFHQNSCEFCVIELLLLNGCRISEILTAKHNQIRSNGFLKINASKHSIDRILVCSQSKNFLLHCRKYSVDPFHGLSRFYFYRLFKKNGISISPKNSSKKAVCHSFRHVLFNQINGSDIQMDSLKNFTGHRSVKSLKCYVEKTK